jgi:hypothetical protein
MYTIKFINHSEITEELLNEIIKVKTAAWPYNYADQQDWIKKNLKSSDIHVLLTNDEKSIAYMNLIKIEFNLDSIKFSGYGIGNVCALEKRKGWGKELLISVNNYLNDNEHIGILFCKQALVKFYSIHGWVLIENEKLVLKKASENIKCMISNKKLNFKKLEYSGELF